MDYQQLLAKYIAHVDTREGGMTFLEDRPRDLMAVAFTDEEWEALQQLRPTAASIVAAVSEQPK